MCDSTIPYFGIWVGRWILTVRLFGCLFQAKRVRDEIFSQRRDANRFRFRGLSVKTEGGEHGYSKA